MSEALEYFSEIREAGLHGCSTTLTDARMKQTAPPLGFRAIPFNRAKRPGRSISGRGEPPFCGDWFRAFVRLTVV